MTGDDLEFLSGDVGGINLTVRVEVNNNFEPTVVVETNGTGRFWIDLDGSRVYSGGNVGAHGELLKAVRDVLEMVLKNPLGLEQGLLSVWATMALDDAGLLRAPTSEADGNA